MHKVHAGYTLLVPLRPDRVEVASALLRELHADQDRLPFAKSTTTFFATVTIIPAQMYRDRELPATLLFATSYCGPTRAHVRELVTTMADELREVFQHCEGVDADCPDDKLEQFILDHRHGDTFYSGMNHLSPEDVRRHRELRDAIQAYIEERQQRGGFTGTATEVRREIQDHVKSRSELAWAQEPFAPSLWARITFYRRSLIVEAAVASLLLCTLARVFIDSTVLGAIVAAGWSLVVVPGAGRRARRLDLAGGCEAGVRRRAPPTRARRWRDADRRRSSTSSRSPARSRTRASCGRSSCSSRGSSGARRRGRTGDVLRRLQDRHPRSSRRRAGS